MRTIVALSIGLALALSAGAAGEAPVVECLGDSITAGVSNDPDSIPYPDVLAQLLKDEYRVINNGVPSLHTYSLLTNFRSGGAKSNSDQNVVVGVADRIVVLAGVNDINLWDGEAGSLYGPAAVIERLRDLGLDAHQAGASTLYLTAWPDDDFSDKKRAAMGRINTWILSSAASEVEGASAVDLAQTLTGTPGVEATNVLAAYHDGSHLHLNAAGHRKLAEVVYTALTGRNVPEAAPEEAAPLPTQVLYDTGVTQSRAVILYNETLMTLDACRRVLAYVSAWLEEPLDESPALDDLTTIAAKFARDLGELEARYHPIHQAYGLLIRDRETKDILFSDEAQRLKDDPAVLARARDEFVLSCENLLRRAEQENRLAKSYLNTIRMQKGLPERATAPRYEDKPDPRIEPDGTMDGLVISVSGALTNRGARLLPSHSHTSYESYDRGYPVPPTHFHDTIGLKTLMVLPCSIHRWTQCDPAWHEAHAGEPIERESAGTYQGQWLWPLDFRYPPVREFLNGYLRGAAEKYRGDQRVLAYMTAWEPQGDEGGPGPWGHWSTGGRTPAAKDAFRAAMKEEFGDIASLNAAWESEYSGFEAIEPPPDLFQGPMPDRAELEARLFSGECPPLYYEFNKFLIDSYADYLAGCYEVLKEADPTHAVVISPSYGEVDGYLGVGRDSIQWADTACDIYASELNTSLDEVFSWSVTRATGKVNAIVECIWNFPENWNRASEDVMRAAGRRNLWRMTAWGRRMMMLYGAEDTYGGSARNNLMAYETDFVLMRPCGGFVEPLTRKLRSMEDAWFGAPVVQPEIAVLNPSTARICSSTWEGVTKAIGKVHDLLYKRNYHYGFVAESFVLSGRASLTDYKVLILPGATHFPNGLTEKLLPWIEQGGTLIAFGVPGGFTPYGKKDGALMKALFGDIVSDPWFDAGEFRWLLKFNDVRPGVTVGGDPYGSVVSASYGEGRAIMFNGTDFAPFARRTTVHLDAVAPRLAWAQGVEVNLRSDDEKLYVTLINPNPGRSVETTVHVRGSYAAIMDRGIEGGFPVPVEEKDDGIAFDVVLAAGEGTMVELGRK